jgi:DNA polymerase elongation subunit (family B)
VLEERQKALKISANATYGFTGSSASKLLLVELAEATINYGSRLLQQAAQWVEERFGEKEHTKVIYGDTDSLMIKMEGKTVVEAMELAQRVSESVTASLPKPITFAYEKIYQPFLLQQVRLGDTRTSRAIGTAADSSRSSVLYACDCCVWDRTKSTPDVASRPIPTPPNPNWT